MNDILHYAEGLGAQDYTIEWIKKRIPENCDIQEAEHVIDYMLSDKAPKRLEHATYEQMKNNTEKWNKTLIKKGKKVKETEDDVEVILDFGDGFKFVKLVGKKSYEREGFLMRHCVASYFGKDTEIYSLRDNENNPHCTIEKDIQIKGKGNGEIHPKYIDYVVRFLEWSGMKVRDSEMNNLGYIVPEFIGYVTNKLYRDKYLRKTEKIKYQNNVIIFSDLNKACKYKGDKICLFSDDADFSGSQVTDLGQLQSIGDDAYFSL